MCNAVSVALTSAETEKIIEASLPVSARKFSNVVIPFDQPSEKGIQPGSDAPAWQGQSRGGRSGRNIRPDRIGGIFWIDHDRYPG